ncbi:MAG: hypothetical protein H6985_08810 [Pseudomonadales bacterium]|nr:hypothetical protein [Pseudomonadales bacterium]
MRIYTLIPKQYLASLVGMFFATLGQNSQAAVMIDAVETGGNVELITSGSLDLTGLTNFSLGSAYQQVIPNQGYVFTGPWAGSGLADVYSGVSGPSVFGTGGQTLATSASGSRVGISNYGQWLYVPNGFVSGTSLSSTTVFAGHTFASLGLTPGNHVWSWSSDSVTLRIPDPSAVPLPGAAWLFGSALIGLAGIKRTNRGRTTV